MLLNFKNLKKTTEEEEEEEERRRRKVGFRSRRGLDDIINDITLPSELPERFCAVVFMEPFLAVSVELS